MTGGSSRSGEETPEQRVERFSRQLVLSGVGAAGQRRWLESRVRLEGGGIAADAARTWLAAAGVDVGDGDVLRVEDAGHGYGSLVRGVEAARATLLALLDGDPPVAPEVETEAASLEGARALVVGAGGLGCPAAMGLAACGAALIRVVDDDLVERSNLPRQVLHRAEDIGRPKVDSLADGLRRRPELGAPRVEPLRERFTPGSARRLLDGVDVVLDASDNFPTKYRVNAAAREAGIPAVIGGALRMDGQVFGAPVDGPCYRCVFAHSPDPGEAPTCSSVGILGPVVGLVGLRQVAVAARPDARLHAFDGRSGDWTSFSLGRRPDCVACGPEPDEPWMR